MTILIPQGCCGTCKNWDQHRQAPNIGACLLLATEQMDERGQTYWQIPALMPNLASCTEWKPKEATECPSA